MSKKHGRVIQNKWNINSFPSGQQGRYHLLLNAQIYSLETTWKVIVPRKRYLNYKYFLIKVECVCERERKREQEREREREIPCNDLTDFKLF